MKVAIGELETAVDRALQSYGYTPDEVTTISEVLLYAQLRDSTQGIAKLVGAGLPKDPDAGEMRVVRETALSALIDGARAPGIIVAVRAMELAIEKARSHMFGIVGVSNTNSSTGAIGYYARKIAEAGYLGFVFSGSPEAVCVHGSYEPLLGTNPIAVGVPSSSHPLVLDMATSAITYYGLVEAASAGTSIPDDVAYDRDGKPTTDPAQAMEGAIRPFDRGHRGSGLALIVEVLTGPLIGAAFTGIGDTWGNWGHTVAALDPGLLVDRERFLDDVARLVERVRDAKRLPGVERILVPGERGDRLAEERLEAGEMEISDNLYRDLRAVGGS